jgi:hypothetical protein
MMTAIAWNKFSHNESLRKSGSAYRAPHFLTNRRHVPPKPFSLSLDPMLPFPEGRNRPIAACRSRQKFTTQTAPHAQTVSRLLVSPWGG